VSKAWVRRPITVLGVVVGALLLTILLPLWVVLSVVFDLGSRSWRLPTLRLLSFAWLWLWLETFGVTGAALIWVTGQGHNHRANYALQRWWAKRLIRSLRITCGLTIEVEGVEALPIGPLICLGRHASLGDALVSAWIFGSLAKRFPRYVMKKELLFDPCLDVVGQRIPNYFVDRGSAAVRQELTGIRTMASNMGERDVAVIFPEGTRTNDAKRIGLVERLERRAPERHAKMIGLRRLLPPRSAGASVLLEEVPGGDVVVMWHVGFDGLDTFAGVRRRIAHAEPSAKVVLELHQRATVPSGEAFEAWLDDRWLEIDAKVVNADEQRRS
jgi:1-acyl-sn-glycerol-3-phosphate acyltransferase